MKVFHGSDHVIRIPVYLGGKTDNDYGNGFYTTEYEDRARSWAALNGIPGKSIVNVYELDMTDLKVLDLNDYGILAWISEVVLASGEIRHFVSGENDQSQSDRNSQYISFSFL